MKKIDLYISILTGIVLGLLLVFVKGSGGFVKAGAVSAQSPVDGILTTMLNSDTKWTTVQGEVEITWYGKKGDVQVYSTTFTISQPDKAFIDTTDLSGLGNDGIWISDGTKIYELNKRSKTYTEQGFPEHFRNVSLLPRSLTDVEQTGMVTVHPLSLLIPSPIKEYVFPSAFAQGNSEDTYLLLGADSLLEKQTWVVKYQNPYGDEVNAWIDQNTGIIMKFTQFNSGVKSLDVVFESLQIDQQIEPITFAVPADYSLVP